MVVTYEVEAVGSVQNGGLAICKEQSALGTLKSLEKMKLPINHISHNSIASLVDVKQNYKISKFSMPISPESINKKGRFEIWSGVVEIDFPDELLNSSIEVMLNVISGEVHHISEVPIVKVKDISFSKDLPPFFRGPKHGISGIRFLLNVYDRPLIIAPVKPSVGLKLDVFKNLAVEAWLGGADIVKDDELHFHCNEMDFYRHVEAMVAEKNKIEDRIGEKKIYICNILTSINRLERRLEIAMSLNVDGVLICPGLQGLGIISYVREKYNGLILCHNAGLSILSRNEKFGFSSQLLAKIQRMAGADIIVIPSPWGTFVMDASELQSIVSILLDEELDKKIYTSLPAFSGGKWAGNISKIHELVNIDSYAIVSGTGVYCHPKGPRAGAKSIRQAISCTLKGMNIWAYKEQNSELGEALRSFD